MNKVWYLQQINLLEGLSESDIMHIANVCEMKKYKKKEIIYLSEDSCNYLYFLKMGNVRLYKLSPDGKELTIALLKAGESFGCLSGTQNEKHNEFAEAMDDGVMICFISRKLFYEIAKKKPSIMVRINKHLGLRVYELELLLEEISFKSIYQRIAHLILRLFKKYSGISIDSISPENTYPIGISLSHYDISCMIGATREATTVALNKLQNEEIIELHRKKIIIKDFDRLIKID